MGKDKKDKKDKSDKSDKKDKKDKSIKELKQVAYPKASPATCAAACSNYISLNKQFSPTVLLDVTSGGTGDTNVNKFKDGCATRCTNAYNEFQAFCIKKATTLEDADRCLRYSQSYQPQNKSEKKQFKSLVKGYKKHVEKILEKD
jgi:hypothetical protein